MQRLAERPLVRMEEPAPPVRRPAVRQLALNARRAPSLGQKSGCGRAGRRSAARAAAGESQSSSPSRRTASRCSAVTYSRSSWSSVVPTGSTTIRACAAPRPRRTARPRGTPGTSSAPVARVVGKRDRAKLARAVGLGRVAQRLTDRLGRAPVGHVERIHSAVTDADSRRAHASASPRRRCPPRRRPPGTRSARPRARAGAAR